MSLLKNVTPLVSTSTRLISRNAPRYGQVQEIPSAHFKKLKADQAKFQVDDGLPVWKKNGLKDRLLWQATLVGCAITTAMAGHVAWKLIMK